MNEIQYFTNQKVIASNINQVMNNLDNSLEYKIDFRSDVSYLSPAFDLSSSSVITSTNRIEKAAGSETRFGRRDQVLKLKEVYEFGTGSLTGGDIEVGDSIEGSNSKAKGIVLLEQQLVVHQL